MGNMLRNVAAIPEANPPALRSRDINDEILKEMPKVELHANLNGSLSSSSIRELSEYVYSKDLPNLAELAKNFLISDGLTVKSGFQKIMYMHQLTSTQEGLKMATSLVIRDFALEGVIQLELCTALRATADMSKREYLNCVLDAIKESKKSYPQIRVKLLPTIDRSQSVLEAEETLKVVMEWLPLESQIITGIDFSGNPNCGEFNHFIPVLTIARDNGLKLAMHCAEIDNREEIDEMLEFGMDRCGHGTFLTEQQHTKLAQRNIPIACCLTNNVKCGTVHSLNDHHFQHIYEDTYIPVMLCSDEGGALGTTLTQEITLAVDTFGLKRDDLLQLSMNAAHYAFTDNFERVHMLHYIKKYFQKLRELFD